MNKQLLFSLILAISGLIAYPQDQNINLLNYKFLVVPDMDPVEYATERAPYKTTSTTEKTSAAITVTNIGHSGNAASIAFGTKSILWGDPSINTITFTHRPDPAKGGGSSVDYLSYDISKDAGATWEINKGPVYTRNGGTAFSGIRYPQGLIYNPKGNINVDDAYLAYFGLTLTGTNDQWGGHGYGVYKLDESSDPTEHEEISDSSLGFWIPTGMTTTQQGTVFHIDPSFQNSDFDDNIILSEGNFVAGDLVYENRLINTPVSSTLGGQKTYTHSDIAFSPDGKTGYLVLLGHNNFTEEPDSVIYPIIYQSTDSGLTWTGPTNIYLNDRLEIKADLGVAANENITAGMDVDIAVDKNGQLHMMLVIGKTDIPWGIPNLAGTFGIFHLYPFIPDTYIADLVHKPMMYNACYGDCPLGSLSFRESNRGQISTSYEGDKLFFTWFDTDTNTFGSQEGNQFPDVYMKGFDVDNETYTNFKNFTQGTAADGVVSFGCVSHYAFKNGADYTVPVAFQLLTDNNNIVPPVQYKYIDGAGFNEADFPVGISEVKNASFSIESIFPNPFKKSVNIVINNQLSSDIQVKIINSLGEITYKADYKGIIAGKNQFKLDLSSLNQGIYFYEISDKSNSVNGRLISIN